MLTGTRRARLARERGQARGQPASVAWRESAPVVVEVRIHVALHAGAHVGEPPDVRQVAAGLDRKQEAGRRLLDPVCDRAASDQAVEGAVHLDGAKALGVALQPATRRYPWRVQLAAPVAVVPAR